ncbi:acetyl-CoA synthetase-like protein [Aaosphaeria arxii CBS 175.79]|uniref:Very long-chain fatty acid transport protein n=1 Tax=Aaosphaeria arxii CBS 175.79 TaxID=1450172 RepID=A0A6A5YBK9_9PLEO|nr:acetyl-CoA synthetase-like protein [Aaosphaeria arxii CBS 175.79]KAF2021994.1 acetyl-CoA synthetase-like protein [Aaosphaeria arxii CBS 175.79]
MQSLSYAIPAAAAGLAYLNARHALRYDWNIISNLTAMNIAGFFHERRGNLNLFYVLEKHAQSSRGNHPWLIFNGRSWTYREGYDVVLKYGTWFKSKGVQSEEIVAMDFVNSDTFIWVWFGLWSIGAKPAFINYNLTEAPLIHTIKTSNARLVLVDENGRGKFSREILEAHGFKSRPAEVSDLHGSPAKYSYQPEGSQEREIEIISFDKNLGDHILSLEPIRQPDSERGDQKRKNMAMLIYTSGTTGLPKPAVMAWGKANLGARFVAGFIPLKKTDIMYTSMPLYHSSAAVLCVCASLQAGSTVALGTKFSHKKFWPEVRDSKATIIQYVGETLRYLLSAPKSIHDKDHNVRLAFGNGLRPDVWEPFKERFGVETVLEIYAATESPSGFWNKSSNTFSSGAIGRNGTVAALLMGASLALVRMDPNAETPEPLRDPDTGLCQLADNDEPGELMYKLDPADISQKFQGYYGNDKATNSKIARDIRVKGDAYFRTGDLLRRDAENRWWWVDRLGDTFRWKSENVSTAEVAGIVGTHGAIDEANVYGVLVPRHDGRAGCAAVVIKDGIPSPDTMRSLAEHVKKSLPSFAVPLFIRVTKAMHTTGTNKQQKHLLQKDGIDVDAIAGTGDSLYWLRDGSYVPFTPNDLESIQGGGVKL